MRTKLKIAMAMATVALALVSVVLRAPAQAAEKVKVLSRELLIGHPYLDVGGIGAFEIFHEFNCADRSDHAKRRFSLAEGRWQPSRQPQI